MTILDKSLQSINLIVFLLLAMASIDILGAQTGGSIDKSIQIPKILNSDEFNLDGIASERFWIDTTKIDDFHQSSPIDGAVPSERTEVQIGIDSEFIYIVIRAYDGDIENLVAKGLIQGQNFFSDDRVNISFDTFNDRRNSYFFQVNPNGIRRDALVGNDYFIDEWDTAWEAESKIHNWGWTTEIRIPIKSIAFDPNSGTWGINFTRNYPRRGEEMAWSSLDQSTRPSAFGVGRGFTGFSQGKGLELNPSVTLGYIDGDQTEYKTVFEPSFTGFYNLTPYLTGGATFNTDFSGTEADDRQINLGRFSLFFPEKREFFLRDASIFEFGGLDRNARPFFSRRIGLSDDGDALDIDAGFRLSGRAGAWNIGSLLVRQNVASEISDETLFVGRVTRNIGKESEFGAIITNGDPNSDLGNSLYGVDYTYRNSRVFGNQNLRSNVWFQESDTSGSTDNQRAFGARVSYPNYKYDGFLDIRRIESDFNPALGFINRSGVEQVNSRLRRRFQLNDAKLNWLGVRGQYFRSERIDGSLQTDRKQFNFIEGISKENDFFTFFVIDQTEGILDAFELPGDIIVDPGEYQFSRYGVFAETGPQREWSTEFLWADGEFFGGDRQVVEVDLNWRPSKHLYASLGFEWNDLDLPNGRFISRLFTASVNLAFNQKWAWLNLIQGDNVSDIVSINSRLRFQPSPYREYFLVLDQTKNNDQDTSDYSIIFKAKFNFRF